MKVVDFDNISKLNEFLKTRPSVQDIKITSVLVDKRLSKNGTEWIFIDKFFVILK